ncbi:MAG: alpha/beta hydrolase [Anaerolineae bacterium]
MNLLQRHVQEMASRPLMPGAEPFWLEAGSTGCLLLHGWGGTPHSFRYLGERLRQADITTFAPLLPGMGTQAADLARTRAADWVHAAEDHLLALHELYPHPFVVGLSMGAILTLYLGAVFPKVVRGIVSINGGVIIRNPEFARLAFRRDLPEIVPSWDESWLLKDRSVTEVAYRQMARTTIVDVLGLAKAVEELLPVLRVPVLILHSASDRVMPAVNATYLIERIGSSSKRFLMLTNSYHVATMDYDKDLVADEVIRFIQMHR